MATETTPAAASFSTQIHSAVRRVRQRHAKRDQCATLIQQAPCERHVELFLASTLLWKSHLFTLPHETSWAVSSASPSPHLLTCAEDLICRAAGPADSNVLECYSKQTLRREVLQLYRITHSRTFYWRFFLGSDVATGSTGDTCLQSRQFTGIVDILAKMWSDGDFSNQG